jgi:hypothetical protein
MEKLIAAAGLAVLSFFTGLSPAHHHKAPVIQSVNTTHDNTINTVITPTPSQNPEDEKVRATGDISMYGQTVTVAILFPKNGGDVKGVIRGVCSGPINGTYSGGNQGTLTANTNASCGAFFTNIQGTASFSGKANLANKIIKGTYTVHAKNITKTGDISFKITDDTNF